MADRLVRITYFLEDFAHEQFVPPLVERIAQEMNIHQERVNIGIRQSTFSRGNQVIVDFRRFLRDSWQALPVDLVVLCVDGNSKGPQEKRRELVAAVQKAPTPIRVVFAIPDPHIEHWYLADLKALKMVLNAPITIAVPTLNRERNYYKHLLEKACQDAGRVVPQGGAEYGRDIVAGMNVTQARKMPSLKAFLDELRPALQAIWRTIQPQP